MFKAFQTPIDGSRQCYTLREALGEPEDTEKTMMSAFYQHLKIGTLREIFQKHQKWLSMINDCEGPTERTVIYQVVESLPTGWKHFYTIFGIGRR